MCWQAHLHKDQPMDLPATEYTSTNYGIIVYFKSAEVMKYLETYLGTETFDEVMHGFFYDWKFKHPYPEDLKNFFERKLGSSSAGFSMMLLKQLAA
jgi:aminopeptidase N